MRLSLEALACFPNHGGSALGGGLLDLKGGERGGRREWMYWKRGRTFACLAWKALMAFGEMLAEWVPPPFLPIVCRREAKLKLLAPPWALPAAPIAAAAAAAFMLVMFMVLLIVGAAAD